MGSGMHGGTRALGGTPEGVCPSPKPASAEPSKPLTSLRGRGLRSSLTPHQERRYDRNEQIKARAWLRL